MKSRIDWLNNQIDRLRADESISSPAAYPESGLSAEDASMLQMAAHLNSLRPGASDLDPTFVADLRARMLAKFQVPGSRFQVGEP